MFKFQIYNIVLLTIVAMLYVRPPELICPAWLKLCTLWPTSPHSLHPIPNPGNRLQSESKPNLPVASHSLQNTMQATGKTWKALQLHISSGPSFLLLPHVRTLVPSFLLLFSPNQGKRSKAALSLCIRSPASWPKSTGLTSSDPSEFLQDQALPSLSFLLSQEPFRILLPAPNSSFYNFYFTILHSLVFWCVHSSLKSGPISFTS